jgi:hygromycin-B 4-O-kinase
MEIMGVSDLLGKDGQITGIIDWNIAMYGDHLYDKANVLFWTGDKMQPLIQKVAELDWKKSIIR